MKSWGWNAGQKVIIKKTKTNHNQENPKQTKKPKNPSNHPPKEKKPLNVENLSTKP